MNDDLNFLGEINLSEHSNKALQEEVFNELRGMQELPEWLRDVMSEDIKRYFNATTPLEQAMIKGAYFRMKFILNMLMKTNEKSLQVEKKPAKIGTRYAE